MPRIRLPWNIDRLSSTHLLVIAYTTLLLGFVAVVLVVWIKG